MRHESPLKNMAGLWNTIRPFYDGYWRLVARDGLPRTINGTDSLRISPRLRHLNDIYEPQVWKCLMQEIRTGDNFVDVGAFVGLYSVAVGLRVGSSGRIWAFEPDLANFDLLTQHIAINALEKIVVAKNMAVSNKTLSAVFVSGKGSESHLATDLNAQGKRISIIALQEFFGQQRVDVLKVDVEGFEQAVLEGAMELLKNLQFRPRSIFIEMHPFAWARSGASSERILQLLEEADYHVYSLDGRRIACVDSYCEVIARPAVATAM